MSFLLKAKMLYQMMEEGKLMEAFERFYDDEVVIMEADGTTRNGKNEQREAIQEWQNMVKEFHGGGAHDITSNEEKGVTMVESWTDVTFKNGGRMKMEEVAIQHWRGDKIIRERFYYNIPPHQR
ncbi:SnoaL-like domain-containing protein [Limibacter armeniacum]|uniref:SnoaL-like domain-containing protein n=1 Tax=Limibacter armeniacum TaxID=466084 RepID=UPI002FE58501